MANIISTGKKFYVRTRHKSTTGLKSAWSEGVKFLSASLSVTKPRFVNGNIVTSSTSTTANISAFSGTGGQTLASLDYQVSRDASFTQITQNVVGETLGRSYNLVNGIQSSMVQYARFRSTVLGLTTLPTLLNCHQLLK